MKLFNFKLNKDIKFYLTLLMLSLITVGIAYLINKQDIAMLNINPNPYLIISVLISAYYGFRYSIMAMGVFNAVFFVALAYQTDFELTETIFTFSNILIPMVNFFVSPLVGEIRQRALIEKQDFENKVGTLKDTVEHFKREVNLKESENLEYKKRLVSKTDTFAELYKVAKKMSSKSIDDILVSTANIIKNNFKTDKIAIYLNKKNDFNNFYLNFQNTDEINPPKFLPEVINRQAPGLIEANEILHTKSTLLLKDSIKLHKGDNGKTLNISAPIVSNNYVVGFIFISGIPFMKYNKENIKFFYVLNDWINLSINEAFRYSKLTEGVIVDADLNVFKYDYFSERAQEEFIKAKKYSLNFNIATLELSNIDSSSPTKKHILEKVVAEVITKFAPSGHCITKKKNKFHLMIPMIEKEKVEKLNNKLIKEVEEYNLKINDSEKLIVNKYVKTINERTDNFTELL